MVTDDWKWNLFQTDCLFLWGDWFQWVQPHTWGKSIGSSVFADNQSVSCPFIQNTDWIKNPQDLKVVPNKVSYPFLQSQGLKSIELSKLLPGTQTTKQAGLSTLRMCRQQGYFEYHQYWYRLIRQSWRILIRSLWRISTTNANQTSMVAHVENMQNGESYPGWQTCNPTIPHAKW